MNNKQFKSSFSPKQTIRRISQYFRTAKLQVSLIVLFLVLGIIANIIAAIWLPKVIQNIIGWTFDKETFSFIKPTAYKLWSSIGILIALYFTYSAAFLLCSVMSTKLSQNVGYHIRQDAFKKIQELPFSYLDSKSVGDLTSRLTNDIDVIVSTLSQNAVSLLQAILTVVGIFIAMMLESVYLTLISIASICILFSLVIVLMKLAQPHFRKQQEFVGDVNSLSEEYISGHKVVSVYSYEARSIDTFTNTSKSLANASSKAEAISRSIMPYNNFINNALMSIVVIVCFVFTMNGTSFLSAFKYNPGEEAYQVTFTFILLVRQFTTPISTIMTVVNQLQLSIVGASRAFEVIDAAAEVEPDNLEPFELKSTSVEFKDVVFSYDKTNPDKKIIKGLSFKAKPGTTNAIVGPTGSGKTTIISLLTRFYDLDSGAILIDGKNIADYKRSSVRKNITMVLQDSFLFSQSIRENIRYGKLDATEEEIIKAAKMSNAWKFIEQLPEGLDTVIDEEKDGISEGQKQLISIARAFLSDAKIIILDEATSYVDTKTEQDIQEGMANLMKDRTSFVIAHRLSTIKNSDNIIVLKNGIKIEEGNHKQLMKAKGFYYKMSQSNTVDDVEQ